MVGRLQRRACLVAAALLLGGAAYASPAATAPGIPARAAALVVELTNAFRGANQRSPLAVDAALAQAAQQFAEHMAAEDRYGHEADGRAPAERARAAGYAFCAIAENIGFQFSSSGFAAEQLARRLMEGWEQSPGHRRNMLLPQVVHIGVGVARSARTQRYYAVQLFGRPSSAAVRFAVANRADVAVRYEIDGESFELPPRVTRTHEGCFGGTLQIHWPEGPASPGFEPGNGVRYAVVRDHAGQLRLQAAR